MRETIGKIEYQNQILFRSNRSKIISFGNYFKSIIPIKIAKFCNASLQKHVTLTDKSSVRKLRVFYLLLIGEDRK